MILGAIGSAAAGTLYVLVYGRMKRLAPDVADTGDRGGHVADTHPPNLLICQQGSLQLAPAPLDRLQGDGEG